MISRASASGHSRGHFSGGSIRTCEGGILLALFSKASIHLGFHSLHCDLNPQQDKGEMDGSKCLRDLPAGPSDVYSLCKPELLTQLKKRLRIGL